MISQQRIDEIAADAVHNAIQDLLDDRMGQGELLSDDLPEDVSGAEQEKEMDRLEAAIRLHLPGNEDEEDDDDEGPKDGI